MSCEGQSYLSNAGEKKSAAPFPPRILHKMVLISGRLSDARNTCAQQTCQGWPSNFCTVLELNKYYMFIPG